MEGHYKSSAAEGKGRRNGFLMHGDLDRHDSGRVAEGRIREPLVIQMAFPGKGREAKKLPHSPIFSCAGQWLGRLSPDAHILWINIGNNLKKLEELGRIKMHHSTAPRQACVA